MENKVFLRKTVKPGKIVLMDRSKADVACKYKSYERLNSEDAGRVVYDEKTKEYLLAPKPKEVARKVKNVKVKAAKKTAKKAKKTKKQLAKK